MRLRFVVASIFLLAALLLLAVNVSHISAQTPAPTGGAPAANIKPNHVPGADCKGCHGPEHQRWALTLHAASPGEVLTNTEHNTEELLTDECITCHSPFQAGKFKTGDFGQSLDQKIPWKLVEANTDKWQGYCLRGLPSGDGHDAQSAGVLGFNPTGVRAG